MVDDVPKPGGLAMLDVEIRGRRMTTPWIRAPILAAVAALHLATVCASPATAAPQVAETDGGLTELERRIVRIFESASVSVVQIAAFTGENDPARFESRIGAGFIWDSAGNIVTNEHVVRGASTIVVWLESGDRLEAEIVGAAPSYDLAVIRPRTAAKLPPPVAVGSSRGLKVGQLVFAIGSPFGLDQSLTMGVISALKRHLRVDDGEEITQVIQTDAAIYPGNSGGPLLDSAGRVVGVNTIAYALAGSHATLGFAIPVDLVKRIVPELIVNGRIPIPGIGIVPADDIAAARLRIEGVAIARVEPQSPAERAGLQASDPSSGRRGDVIVAINGRPVRRAIDLAHQLEQIGVGRRIGLTIDRNGGRVPVELDIVDIGGRR